MGPSYIVYEEVTNKSGVDNTDVTRAMFQNSQQKISYIYFYPNYPLICFLH